MINLTALAMLADVLLVADARSARAVTLSTVSRTSRTPSRAVRQLLLFVFVLVFLFVPVARADPLLTGDGGTPPFYTWRGTLTGEPGTLLRQEAGLEDLANAGRSVRILYVSTDGIGGKAKVPVSGALYLPKGNAPKDGWPLIAWAHGTVGVADVCAPSFAGRSPGELTYLNFWLGQAYAVVATDYQGLGVPGPHPYLATRPEAYSVLDSVRAVQRSGFGISTKVVLVGQSQGGEAVFATAGYTPSYAPELDIRGTVATGTGYLTPEIGARLRATFPRDVVTPVLGYGFYLMSLTEQIDPSFSVRDYLTGAALPVVLRTATTCYPQTAREIVAYGLSYNRIYKKDPVAVDQTLSLIAYLTLSIKTPVFLGTGGEDHDVPPRMQLQLGADACAKGSTIEQHLYPELDHSGTVNGSISDSLPFVQRAFAGEKIAGNCGARPTLGE
jgi:pimeloyl-ACP methyl ester carboxylesterase